MTVLQTRQWRGEASIADVELDGVKYARSLVKWCCAANPNRVCIRFMMWESPEHWPCHARTIT